MLVEFLLRVAVVGERGWDGDAERGEVRVIPPGLGPQLIVAQFDELVQGEAV